MVVDSVYGSAASGIGGGGNAMKNASGAALEWLLAVAAGFAPVVAVAAPLGLAPLATLVLVAGIALGWRDKPWHSVDRPLVGLVLALAVWGVAGTSWAMDPGQAAKSTLKLVVMTLAGLTLVGAIARGRLAAVLAARGLAIGCAAAAALLLWEYLGHRATSQFIRGMVSGDFNLGAVGAKSPLNRGATVLGLLQWPLALLATRHFGLRWGAMVVAAVTGTILLGDSGSARLAALAALAVFTVALLRPRAAFRALRVGVAVMVVAMPLGAANLPPPQETFQHWTWLPLSLHHRLTIWTFTGARIAEKPVTGWAMDASRSMPGADDEIRVSRYDRAGNRVSSLLEAQLPLHPHNAILQWWLELGAVGAVMLAALFWRVLVRMERLAASAGQRAAGAALFTAVAVVSLTGYGFWQGWWQGGIWLAILLYTLAVAAGRQEQSLSTSPTPVMKPKA